MAQLPVDCLDEIFEYLYDHFTLRNFRQNLWRTDWSLYPRNYIILIPFLPNESKEVLYENGIIISTPTSKHSMFNYTAFCKDLSIYYINDDIGKRLQFEGIENWKSRAYIVKCL